MFGHLKVPGNGASVLGTGTCQCLFSVVSAIDTHATGLSILWGIWGTYPSIWGVYSICHPASVESKQTSTQCLIGHEYNVAWNQWQYNMLIFTILNVINVMTRWLAWVLEQKLVSDIVENVCWNLSLSFCGQISIMLYSSQTFFVHFLLRFGGTLAFIFTVVGGGVCRRTWQHV